MCFDCFYVWVVDLYVVLWLIFLELVVNVLQITKKHYLYVKRDFIGEKYNISF